MVRKRNSDKTMVTVRKENSNNTTGRNLNCRNTVGRTRNSYACYRVGKSFQKPVVKPTKFVSHTRKRNTNTIIKPMSIDDTRKQFWAAFFFNGRYVKGDNSRMFHNSCTLFCEVTFVNSELHSFWKKSCGTVKEPHAEIKALEEIRNLEENYVAIWKVDMLLSFSPCANCADAIIKFKRQRKHLLQISLAFTAIFQDVEGKHRQGLKQLDSVPGIMLRVFTENDWVRLAKETDMNYRRNPGRKEHDGFWDSRLQEILKKDAVLDMDVDVGLTLPRPRFTSTSFRKYEWFVGIVILLVVILVVTAMVSKLKK